jgi:hypothetical protein
MPSALRAGRADDGAATTMCDPGGAERGGEVHPRHPCGEGISSIENCISVFMPRVKGWRVYNASSQVGMTTIASGAAAGTTVVADPDGWRLFTSGTRRDTVREVASHGYLNTPTRETGVDDTETMLVRTESATARAVGMPSPEIIEAESRIAVRRALAIHRALGVGAAFWEDGKVLVVPPEQLPRDINDVEWTERQIAGRSR